MRSTRFCCRDSKRMENVVWVSYVRYTKEFDERTKSRLLSFTPDTSEDQIGFTHLI